MPERSLSELRGMVGTSHVTAENLAVEGGKIDEFARSLGDDDPVYRSAEAARERGFDGIPAPLTFTRIHRFPRYVPDELENYFGFDLGFDRRRSLHGEQEYEFERVLREGDVLTGVTTLLDVYQREGSRGGTMTFAVFETVYRDENDEDVLTERWTRIETGGEE